MRITLALSTAAALVACQAATPEASLIPPMSTRDQSQNDRNVAAGERATKRPTFEIHSLKELMEPNATTLAAQELIASDPRFPPPKELEGYEGYALAPLTFAGATLKGGGLSERAGVSNRFFFFFDCSAIESVGKLVEADLGPAAKVPLSEDLSSGRAHFKGAQTPSVAAAIRNWIWTKPTYSFKLENSIDVNLCTGSYQVSATPK
jgi:hypothetical protein